MIVEQTNIKAQKYFEDNPRAEDYIHKKHWNPLSHKELKAFLGIILYMGIVKLPEMRHHWEQGIVLRPSAASSIMPRDRFMLILKFLHLNNDAYDFKTDSLYKVRQFLLTLLPNFKKFYQLEENISIDEKMIKFTGRSHMKQYVKNKAVKWGFKVFILAEASSGYVYDWKLYEGKKYSTQKKNLSFSIVTDLVTGLENKGHKLYTDNYYTSIDLALALMEKQIGLTGTIRSNRRRLPENIMKIKKIEKGKSLVLRAYNKFSFLPIKQN